MKAWVVSITSFEAAKDNRRHATVVVAVLSARKHSAFVRDLIENLFTTTRVDLRSQIDASKYVKPKLRGRARVIADCDVSLASHPYVFRAQRSDILGVRLRKDGTALLKWKGVKYETVTQDSTTCKLKRTVENPPAVEAPQIIIPLRKLFGPIRPAPTA